MSTEDDVRWVKPVTGVVPFLQSLDWSEPWIYCLAIFYPILFAGVYVTRKSSVIQSFSFVFLLVVVYVAEDLNEYFARNHKAFTKHQYFDSNGMFISAVMSFPLLLACAFIAVNWFGMSTELIVRVKQLQIRSQLQLKAVNETEAKGKEKTS